MFCEHDVIRMYLFVMFIPETWEWNYVGEAGETITARNSHSLHVITVPNRNNNTDTNTNSTGDAAKESCSGAGSTSYLVVFGGSSPELGPLGDTFYAELPSEGITSESSKESCSLVGRVM